jgi:hypothetical protein
MENNPTWWDFSGWHLRGIETATLRSVACLNGGRRQHPERLRRSNGYVFFDLRRTKAIEFAFNGLMQHFYTHKRKETGL